MKALTFRSIYAIDSTHSHKFIIQAYLIFARERKV